MSTTTPRTPLYLITHAHTQPERTTDATQWHLSAQGERQAALLAAEPFWGLVEIIALSGEAKTRLTVAPLLAQRPLPVVVDERFDELKRPGWSEEYEQLVAQAFARPDHPAGAWEAASAALGRFLNGVADLSAQYPGHTLALVGHGLTLSLYRAHLLGNRYVQFDDWRQLSFAAVALAEPSSNTLLADFRAVAGESPRGG